ncbi:MAG: alginate export family protein [Sphingomonadales bacterium]
MLISAAPVVTAMIAQGALAEASAGAECAEPAAPATNPYKGVFYDNDFSHLDDPCLADRDPLTRAGDSLKRMELGSGIIADLGGEYRLRFHDENNFAHSRLDGRDNNFTLNRLRLYLNTEVGEHIRVYAEAIDARSFGEDLPARPIEVDHWDILDLFAEFKAGSGDSEFSLRVGRQDLLFGAQRLISPLDWANARRSFDGVRLDYAQPGLAVSGFFVSPRHVRPTSLNDTNGSVTFGGLYASFTGIAGQTVDGYALRLEETAGQFANFEIYTLGGRWKGGRGNLMWEFEGAYQWGDFGPLKQRAGMTTAALGYKLDGLLPLKPEIWVLYDWASGDGDSTDGKRGTFHQHFPLAHAYFGFVDLMARQNVRALALRLVARPHRKLTLNVTGHSFDLANRHDAQYNALGALLRIDPTGASGKNVGEEIDILAKIAVLPRLGLVLGYSRFWGGSFVDATNPPGVSGNVSFLYSQISVKF